MDTAIYLAEDYYYHAQEALTEGNRNVALSLLKSASQLQPNNDKIEKERQEINADVKKNWDKEYDITRIQFDVDKTVIFFKVQTKGCHFFGPNHQDAWFIRNSNNFEEAYKMTSLRNLSRNSATHRVLSDNEIQSYTIPHPDFPKQLHTCELHFPPLPAHISMIDLIEGPANELDEAHWNIFDYTLPNRG